MRGLQKSKRVSWASDLNLCQVKLFLSEESPSQVGLNSQDHLQAKTSSVLYQGEPGSDDILPPGFEGTCASSQFDINLSQIPVISWVTPHKIVLDVTWLVAAGEESKEIIDQPHREMRVLEAIYPRISSIPPNPSVPLNVEDSHYMDDHTIVIPITPVEDGDVAAEISSHSSKQYDVSQSHGLSSGIFEGSNSVTSMSDVAAASVALTSIVKSSEHGNLIDRELLNNILNNPEVIEKLVRDYGVQNNAQYVQNTGSSSGVFSQHPTNRINQVETTTTSSNPFLSTSSYAHTNGGQMAANIPTQWHSRSVMSSTIAATPVDPPSTRDVNYYKSLIQQHGGDKQEALPYSSNNRQNQQPLSNYETVHNFRAKGSKPKIMKPCIFFNSSRGCRNGTNCTFQHDASFQQQGNPGSGMQSSKRMKMDNEISS
ncbi:zinc finger CCCH domain-containing protein 6 [Vicia villosa]|uniref:zinc finger CCCH domain-containing protein 6 n=1 Tax=Vicia villosa TaxID=3911 RepID=UPI00273B09B5|nr:zinc finger CCCH domain-containing protein 6 [Vicia villosa]